MKNSLKSKIIHHKETGDCVKHESEEMKLKKEEYQELLIRQKKQKDAAEEATRRLAKKKPSNKNSYYIVFAFLIALSVYAVVIIFSTRRASLDKIPVINEPVIEEHNDSSSWQQGPNKIFEASSLADAKRIINTSFSSRTNLSICNVDESITIPDSFDYRKQWPNCVSFIKNQQKTCGSSYAIAVTQTLSDRKCILNSNDKPLQYSPQELISCDEKNSGCKGGYLDISLDYIKNKGVVEESCFPYEADFDTVKCDKMCPNGRREQIESYCVLYGEEDIKRDIYRHGPVIGVMQIHIDFLTYKSGIYQIGDEVPKFSGNQAVIIVGWGLERNEATRKERKFWIIKNTWGEDWGENGYAQIAYGQELLFEQYAYSLKLKRDSVGFEDIPQRTKRERNFDVSWDIEEDEILGED